MQQYERDTWYDLQGRISFTNSKGLIGVGLPRKGSSTQPTTRLTLPDGTTRDGQYGWEDVHNLPEGNVVQQWVQDDTLPTGPYLKERHWLAPCARASREDDYRLGCGAGGGADTTEQCHPEMRQEAFTPDVPQVR